MQEKVLCIGLCTAAEGKERFKSLPYGIMPNEFDNLAAHGLQTTTKGEEGKMQTEKLFCKQYVEENPARRRHLRRVMLARKERLQVSVVLFQVFHRRL